MACSGKRAIFSNSVTGSAASSVNLTSMEVPIRNRCEMSLPREEQMESTFTREGDMSGWQVSRGAIGYKCNETKQSRKK